MEVKLIVVGGDAKTTEIDLKLPTVIGRGRGATLTLPHPLVSRQHCELYEAEGQLYVRDLGSLNGTFIGNEPISEAVLPPGELLTVGAVTFRAIYGELLEEERRNRHAPPVQKPSAPSTRALRSEGVETTSQPVRTVKEAPAPSAPAKSPPSPLQVDEVIVVEEEAEIYEFRESFDDDEDLLAIDVEEIGVEADSSSDSLFTGAEEESFDVIDEVLPEGSTFDRARRMHAEDTSASLPQGAPSTKAEDVKVIQNPAHGSPPCSCQGDGAAKTPGADPALPSPESVDEELLRFLRKVN
jgi:pSer/pThr/pTyr-binding forkhead associated (FHA) protein